MTDTRGHIDQADLQEIVSEVFGSGFTVADVTRMQGGAQKVVYKVECTNRFVCVLYVWDLSNNFFRQEIENENESREFSYGSECFEVNNRFLSEQGIRTPSLYYLEKEKKRVPYDFALAEYVDGRKAETYFQADPGTRDTVLRRTADLLAAMQGITRNRHGHLKSSAPGDVKCHLSQLNNAILQLSFAAQHLDSIRLHQDKLLEAIHTLEARIGPRSSYSFVHGELGPDHVLVNGKLEPFLIDIEGALFHDIEHEFSFMEFRFGSFYRYFANDMLDPDRMRFYRLHHHISCTSGGLKLLQRGFPDRKLAQQIVDYNGRSALRFVEGEDAGL